MTPLRENGNELSGAFTEERVFPVSFGQQRLWIIDQIFPGITTYNVPLFLRLTGPLKIPALELSLQTIVHRHETLRTRFAARDGVPAQIVASTCTMPLQTTDLRSSIEENLEQDALLLAQRELNTSFNLSEAPLIRARLVRLTPTNHILLITLHHIISDGSSAELLTRELAQYYAAFSTGQQPSIKSLPMQYSEFSIIQRRLFQSGQLDSQFLYWRKILAGTPTLHTLPCDLSRPEQPSYSGATVTLHLDNDLMDGLSDLARRHRATTFMVLVTAFQVLLSKCSGQTDLVVGTPVSGAGGAGACRRSKLAVARILRPRPNYQKPGRGVAARLRYSSRRRSSDQASRLLAARLQGSAIRGRVCALPAPRAEHPNTQERAREDVMFGCSAVYHWMGRTAKAETASSRQS